MDRMIMELVQNRSFTLTTGDSKQIRLRRLNYWNYLSELLNNLIKFSPQIKILYFLQLVHACDYHQKLQSLVRMGTNFTHGVHSVALKKDTNCLYPIPKILLVSTLEIGIRKYHFVYVSD